jgi:hypothetical protein
MRKQRTTFLFGSSPKSFWILNYKIYNQFKFESCLNFKGIQIFLEKSDKFLQIPCSRDILEYNFTLTHLYSKFKSFFTSGKNDLVKLILKITGHLGMLGPLTQIHH